MIQMENTTFEQAIKRLGEITEKIENGELTLDESIRLYEEGIKLTGACEKMLEQAELKLKKYNGENEDAN